MNLKQFMQRVFNPYDKLDEIAIVFAYNYYKKLNGGVHTMRELAPLYSKQSVG